MHKIFVGHECSAASACGWAGIKNGELLRLAEGLFDVFVTADQNIRYQQNLSNRQIAILELSRTTYVVFLLHPLCSSPQLQR